MTESQLFLNILNFSERASIIARSIREEKDLFELLVEEKIGGQKNERFVQDFKTLADVLIQQLLCYNIREKFRPMASSVYGEESTVFSNTLGESVAVEIKNNEDDTAQLLKTVLNGNAVAAQALAKQIHRKDIEFLFADLPQVKFTHPLNNLAIWIDPIDSTAEYIKGGDDCTGSGLSCVTVLVGVFSATDGAPVAGVVCQPFSNRDAETGVYRTAVWWGVVASANNVDIPLELTTGTEKLTTVLVSSSECSGITRLVTEAGLLHYSVSGAGYKILQVIVSAGHAYLCSKGSTYMWDTCGPHAVLRSLGGGMIAFSALHLFAATCPPDHTLHQLRYVLGDGPRTDIQRFCHGNGIVAYRCPEQLYALARAVCLPRM